jgi:polyadenylate-binding protein
LQRLLSEFTSPSVSGSEVFVGNVPHQLSDEQLMRLFACYGTVTAIEAPKYPETQRRKGFVFVKFEHPDSAATAIAEMNEITIFGRKLFVELRKK